MPTKLMPGIGLAESSETFCISHFKIVNCTTSVHAFVLLFKSAVPCNSSGLDSNQTLGNKEIDPDPAQSACVRNLTPVSYSGLKIHPV